MSRRLGALPSSCDIWIDPNDLTTMYQERTLATAATKVAAVNDPCGLIFNKGFRGGVLVAPSDAARPTLQIDATRGRYVLRFDGVDDRMSNAVLAETGNVFHLAPSIVMGAAVLWASSPVVVENVFYVSRPGGATSVRARIAGGVTANKHDFTANTADSGGAGSLASGADILTTRPQSVVIQYHNSQDRGYFLIDGLYDPAYSTVDAAAIFPDSASASTVHIGANGTASQFADIDFYGCIARSLRTGAAIAHNTRRALQRMAGAKGS